jgi:hypothetical protein
MTTVQPEQSSTVGQQEKVARSYGEGAVVVWRELVRMNPSELTTEIAANVAPRHRTRRGTHSEK